MNLQHREMNPDNVKPRSSRPVVVIAAGLSGLIFGFGLILSGMANPAKVKGFLDLAGHWDPSLAFVMGGAIAAAFIPFSWARRHERSVLGEPMSLPTSNRIDARLIGGSALFGIGWGIARFCPGPALVGLGMGLIKAIAFVVAMLAGMAVFEWIESGRGARQAVHTQSRRN